MASVEHQFARFSAANEAMFDTVRAEIRSELRSEIRSELQSEMRAQMSAERETVAARLNQVAAQSSSIVEQVNDATAWLNRRVEDTGRTLEARIDERSTLMAGRLDEVVTTTDARVAERLADVDASLDRIGHGVDEAIATMSQRLAELDEARLGIVTQITALADDVGKIDQQALDDLRDQMSGAVGESMLVRIEMERMGAGTAETVDKLNVRIGELAAQIADTTMDVSAAVQLERLEEIERALIELDPDQFLRNPDYIHPSSPAGTGTAADNGFVDDDHSNELGHPGRHAAAEVQAYDRVAEVMQSPAPAESVAPASESIPDPVWADADLESESNLSSW